MARLPYGLLTLLLILVGTSLGSAQVRLEPKLTPNDTWKIENEIKTSQVLTLAGMNIETAGSQTIALRKTVSAPADDGRIRVKHAIEQLQASLSLPGGVKLDFDSARPDAAPPGTQFDLFLDIFRAMARASWTEVHGPDGRVVAVEGEKEILASINENLRPALERQFEPEYLIEQANNELDKLPSSPVNIGDSWQRTFNTRLDSGQNLNIVTRFEYIGTVDRDGVTLDQIGARAIEIRYSIDQDAPTPLRVSSSDLKLAESDGMFLFDRARGQIIESRDKMHIVGDINFVIAGMPQPGKVDLTMEVNRKRT
jgi:hypothetical protein